ncbi:small multi-drug export protein [Bacillus sp. FJAT-44742]|uniref:small multi-drug export protein n=1 Tax=Bacillus sp. FJAT-44742 TaxID=2014005 RepID=UPI000C246F63|nr:small multi-drug export protein [Bacillus sp. FJAT-44742]
MDFATLLWAYILVFALSAIPFFEAYAVIPLAIIAGLSILPSIVIGLAGNLLTVLFLVLFIEQIKAWRKKRKGVEQEQHQSKRHKRAQKLWQRYGLPGLAVIGPLFVGSHLTAFMCVTLGGSKHKTVYWVLGSISLWSIVFSVLAYYGIDLLGNQEDGFIRGFFE